MKMKTAMDNQPEPRVTGTEGQLLSSLVVGQMDGLNIYFVQ